MTTTRPSAPRLTFRGGGGGGGGMYRRDSQRAVGRCGQPQPAPAQRRDRTGGMPPPPPRHLAASLRCFAVRRGPAVGRHAAACGATGTPAASPRRFVGRVSWAAEPGMPERCCAAPALRWAWKRRLFAPLCSGLRCGGGRRFPVITAAPNLVWAVDAGFRSAARAGMCCRGRRGVASGMLKRRCWWWTWLGRSFFGRRDGRRFRCPIEVFAYGDSTLHEHGFQIFGRRVVSRLPASSKVSVTSQVTRRGISPAFRPLLRLLVVVTRL